MSSFIRQQLLANNIKRYTRIRGLNSTRRRLTENEIIASTQPPQPPAMATPSLEFNRDIGKTDRVYHPFDTYKFVTTLQAYGYSRRISEIIMVATRWVYLVTNNLS